MALARGRPDVARDTTAKLLANDVNAVRFNFRGSLAGWGPLRRRATVSLYDGRLRGNTRLMPAAEVRLVRPVTYAVHMKTKTKIQTGSLYDVIRHGAWLALRSGCVVGCLVVLSSCLLLFARSLEAAARARHRHYLGGLVPDHHGGGEGQEAGGGPGARGQIPGGHGPPPRRR